MTLTNVSHKKELEEQGAALLDLADNIDGPESSSSQDAQAFVCEFVSLYLNVDVCRPTPLMPQFRRLQPTRQQQTTLLQSLPAQL